MGQPYVGEIRMFAGNFAPAGWKFCNGELLPINQNETLFQLIGTTYGGDGQSTFALPNLQSRVPIHREVLADVGIAAGVESVTLTTQQIPVHNHAFLAQEGAATETTVQNNLGAEAVKRFYSTPSAVTPMGGFASPAGGSQPHDNMQPFLVISFIISLFGIFPSPT